MNRRISIEGTKKNLCRAFILPMCGMNYKLLPNNFINCYITLDYHLILVFDKTQEYDDMFYIFFENIKRNIKCYNGYEEEEDEIILIFKVPEIFKDEFDLFLKGKYSEFSEQYKKILCSFHGRKTIKDDYTVTEYNVIYPEDFKRKQIAEFLSCERSEVDYKTIKEVIDKPDLNKEIYKPLNVLIETQNI